MGGKGWGREGVGDEGRGGWVERDGGGKGWGMKEGMGEGRGGGLRKGWGREGVGDEGRGVGGKQ